MDESTLVIKMQLDRLRFYDLQVAALPKSGLRTHLQYAIGVKLEQLYKFQVESAKGHPTVQATSVTALRVGGTEAPNRTFSPVRGKIDEEGPLYLDRLAYRLRNI